MKPLSRIEGKEGNKPVNSATFLERSFGGRGEDYSAAGLKFPLVRRLERQTLIDLLAIQDGDLVVDLQAAAGYLANGIKDAWGDKVGTICVEPSSTLRAAIDWRRHLVLSDPLEALSVPDCFVSKVGCLAGTHHCPRPELLFREAWRVLKPGGLFAVAEVQHGGPMAQWLNGFVDSQLPEGHNGIFPDLGTFLYYLEESGFSAIQERLIVVPWDFESLKQAVEFCKTLFGIKGTDEEQVELQILTSLPNEFLANGGFRINWELIYAKGVKK